MLKTNSLKIFTVLIMLLSGAFAIDECAADSSYHIDIRTQLSDGSQNPNYGQEIATGLCTCIDFQEEFTINSDDSTVTLIVRIVDNEPIRGAELDIYHNAPELVLESYAKGAKLENVTNPAGQPKTMTILANKIDEHIKVMAYSTSQAQTGGDGEEGVLFYITYKATNGVEALVSPVNFWIGINNIAGTSKAPDIYNVVCSFPDSLNPTSINMTLDNVEISGVPTHYNLSQNYPNPFNPTTNIAFDIPQSGQVIINIYNLIGQQVVTLINEEIHAGRYEVEWNGLDAKNNIVASGVYFYELRSENYNARKKMILLR